MNVNSTLILLYAQFKILEYQCLLIMLNNWSPIDGHHFPLVVWLGHDPILLVVKNIYDYIFIFILFILIYFASELIPVTDWWCSNWRLFSLPLIHWLWYLYECVLSAFTLWNASVWKQFLSNTHKLWNDGSFRWITW